MIRRRWQGVIKLLYGFGDWKRYFDLSETGRWEAVCGFVLSVATLYAVALVAGYKATQPVDGLRIGLMAAACYGSFFICIFLYGVTIARGTAFWPSVVWPWVIVRYWMVFFITSLGFVIMCAYGLDIIGFHLAYIFGLGCYLNLLYGDIMLARRAAGLPWGAAILWGCVVQASGLLLSLWVITNLYHTGL